MRTQIHDNPIDHGRACSLSRGTWRRVGAKLACAGACALMAGQLLLPSVALAADWVNVGGTQYDAGTAAGDEAGTWSWDGANDMKLNGYDGGSIGAKGNLTIDVTGINTVTADARQSAIEVKDGNLAITGEGTLNATAQDNVLTASGDGVTNGDITISGSSVNVISTGSFYCSNGIRAKSGNVKIDKGADVKIEAKKADGLHRPPQSAYGIFADGKPGGRVARESGQEEPDYVSVHGGDVTIDGAKVAIKTADGPYYSAGIHTLGINKNTLLQIVNGADVEILAGDVVLSSRGIDAQAEGGSTWMLVQKSNLTVRTGGNVSEPNPGPRREDYGIIAAGYDDLERPQIRIFKSNVEASGLTAGIYVVNRKTAGGGPSMNPALDIMYGSVITTPAGGTVRETAGNGLDYDTAGNGLVIGTAGSSTIQDIKTSNEVARNVVISYGDAAEPEPTPQPDPAPEPTPQPEPTPVPAPQPGGGSETGTPSVTPTQASSTAAASKPAAKAVAAQKSAGALAATGDSAATTAAALGIAGASVIGAGFVASKRRNR